mmetsp:Transcript_52436/g.125286  ORF Transcript_52436/g.125286 Transcript_52436/m.125286 type:complete len:233 (-) Transcript_52436:208-906(-)
MASGLWRSWLRPAAASALLSSTAAAASAQRQRRGDERQFGHLTLPLPLAAPLPVQCEDAKFRRATSIREFDHIRQEHFTPEMSKIAHAVDFRSLLVEGCFLLEGVGPDVIERLVFGERFFVTRGTYLIKEGLENSALFLVGHGTLSVSSHGVHVASVGPGGVVGLVSMLREAPASADVCVESESAYLLELRHHHFLACLDNDPAVIGRLHLMLHQRELQNRAAAMMAAARAT